MEQEYKYRRFAFVTWILIGICVIVFALECYLTKTSSMNPDALIALGGVNSALVKQGQLWRLFTAMWLHESPQHLLSNMLFMYLTGRQLEKVFGHFRFLMIYLFSGLIGDITACFLSSPKTVSVGASTAIFGIMLAGATLRWTTNEVGYGKAMMELFISNIVLDMFMPGISLVGHLGGAAIGFVLGFLLQPRSFLKWYTNLAFQIFLCVAITLISISILVAKV